MVFIRKKLVEDDFTTKQAAELVDAGIETIAAQDTSATPATSESSKTEDTEKMPDGKSSVSMNDAELTTDQETAVKDIASLDEAEKAYNWHEILTILSDYVNPQALEQIEDDWMQNYPNNTMGQEDVDDLLSDIAISFNEEIASEIEARINQLQNSNSILKNNFSTEEFEKLLNNTVEQYNSGLLSKLEYIGQVGTLVKDFIKDLANVPEDKREELFNKAEELINNLIK